MRALRNFVLSPERPVFPPPEAVRDAPTDLVATYGNLEPDTLLAAYRLGLFPWYNRGDPILWHSPDPRTVISTAGVHISRSLARTMRRKAWTCALNARFDEVVLRCAQRDEGTWLLPEMRAAYSRLHRLGHAHAVAVTDGDALIGGIYGVGIGRMFFGESMFSHRADASKVALVTLCRHLNERGFPLLDCQVWSDHLASMGASRIVRADFMARIAELCARKTPDKCWAARVIPTKAQAV